MAETSQRTWVLNPAGQRSSGQWIDDTLVERKVTSIKDAQKLSFEAKEAGVYLVQVEAYDKIGRRQQVSIDFFVGGQSPVTWARAPSQTATVTADKESYAPGETATRMLSRRASMRHYFLMRTSSATASAAAIPAASGPRSSSGTPASATSGGGAGAVTSGPASEASAPIERSTTTAWVRPTSRRRCHFAPVTTNQRPFT